jgi:hypothetical protein
LLLLAGEGRFLFLVRPGGHIFVAIGSAHLILPFRFPAKLILELRALKEAKNPAGEAPSA